MVVEKYCIEKLVNLLEEKPDFVAVTPVVYDMTGKFWGAGVKRHYTGINTTYKVEKLLNKLEYIQVDECNTIFMVRKSDLQKINGFNENIKFYYEESEMFYRLKKITNKKIVCLLSAVAYHDVEKNKLGKINTKKAYLLGKNRVRFYYVWCNSKFHLLVAITTFLSLIVTYYLYVFLISNNLLSWISLVKGFLSGVLSGGDVK